MGAMPMQKKGMYLSTQVAFINDGLPVYGSADKISNVNAYVTADDVYSIVRRIASAAAAVERTVYIVKSDRALEKWQNFRKNVKTWDSKSIFRDFQLRTKALEEAPEGTDLGNLLNTPNDQYSKTEFLEGAYIFRLLTGNTYIYTPTLENGVNAGKPIEMWLCPSQYMALQVSETWPRRILQYKLVMANIIKFEPDQIMHIRYFNPLYTLTGTELMGLSPITAANRVVARQEAETNYSVNAFQNSGSGGIITNKSIGDDELAPEVLGKKKAEYYAETSGVDNAKKTWFTVGDVAYIQTMLSPVDMNVIQSEKMTFKRLCNIYSVSDRLFNNDATGSEISVHTVYKDFYTNAVLPECYALDDAINKSIVPKFNKAGVKYYVCTEIDDIPELQENLKEMAAVYSTLPIMHPNFISEKFGMGDSEDPEMNKFYIKSGWQPIDDMAIDDPEPLPDA